MEMHTAISLAEKKLIMLNMLDEIDRFCREKQLTYFLVGGTLLGAIRHKGYIPWDDDIDIGLPRADYNKLMHSFISQSGYVKIINSENFEHYRWPGAKAIDTRTKLIELGDEKSTIGVFIDIFPFDGVKGNYETIKKEALRSSKWQYILALKRLRIDPRRSIAKNLIIAIGRVTKVIPDYYLIKKINSVENISKPFSECEYICNFSGAWGIREITKASNFTETVDAEFEGKMYKIPKGYDDYLKTVYGDYMKLPPVEKQVTHHSSEAYWRE